MLPYLSEGTGPGVVIVHGSGVVADDYQPLAAALADRFTVHRYDRRGRRDSPPQGPSYSVATDVDDLSEILEATGARTVLGHSFGGLVALQGALRLPIDRVVVYDAVLPVAGGFPAGFAGPMRRALDVGDTTAAMIHMADGLRTTAVWRLPVGVQRAMIGLLLRTRVGATMADLLPSVLVEVEAADALDGPASQYAALGAATSLLVGASSPAYFHAAAIALADAAPDAKQRRIKGGHDLPMRSPKGFAAIVAEALDGRS